MLIVTGGANAAGARQSSTEVYDYTASPLGSWRLAGTLPSARSFLAGGTIANVFYATGGSAETDTRSEVTDEVLAWAADTETWSLAGLSLVGRWKHAVTPVKYFDIFVHCI